MKSPSSSTVLSLAAVITALFSPSESSAFIRRDLPDASLFITVCETCRNDPVNNSDPTGLMDYSWNQGLWENSAPMPWAHAEKPSEVLPEVAHNLLSTFNWGVENLVAAPIRGALSEAAQLSDRGVSEVKTRIDETMGPGYGDAAEAFLMMTPAAVAQVSTLIERVGVVVGKAGSKALTRTGRVVSEAVEWRANRPLGATTGSIQIRAAERTLAQGAGAESRQAQFVRELDRVGNPQQYVRPDAEHIVDQNQAGNLGLFRGQAPSVEIPPSTTPVLHTHTRTPIPSTRDFIAAPVGELQYLEAPQGGVLYMRQTLFRGIYTEPGTGRVIGDWTAW